MGFVLIVIHVTQQAQAAVAALREKQADRSFTPNRRAREADAGLARYATEARRTVESLLQQVCAAARRAACLMFPGMPG